MQRIIAQRFRKKNFKEEINEEVEEDVFAQAKKEKSAAVVSIEMMYPRDFGFNSALVSKATGFIVDVTKGILLSNKHVVHDGPCRAKAKFMKNEEIDIIPIYRDPVHDFGFFKFDPALITETPQVQIELDPGGAKTGRNALIIGNNGGEKLSFITTTVARVDRPSIPPLDMNTFYITASDTGVGGSSGAPLLSSDGKAIAMMAAGDTQNNISMYLPLFRVQRALEFIRNGESVPRGTIQCALKHQTFDAMLKRNTVSKEEVDCIKQNDFTAEGLLVFEKTVPNGPGHLAGVMNGDILLSLNGNLVHNFVQVEEVLDTFIGKKISMTVIRENKRVELKLTVQNHDEIAVTEMVEVSNGIFHTIEYKIASLYNRPVEGVFVSKQGFIFQALTYGAIIKRIGSSKILNLQDFIQALQALKNGQQVSVHYQAIGNQNKTELVTVTVDKTWFPFQLATRNDAEGTWNYKDLVVEQVDSLKKKTSTPAGESIFVNPRLGSYDPNLVDLLNTVVEISFFTPFNVDDIGMHNSSTSCGIIVDAKLGLVIVDESDVPGTLIDIKVTFNLSKTIDARVLFIHPQKNFSIIQFDPTLLHDDATVRIREAVFSNERPAPGDDLVFVGQSHSFKPIIRNTSVMDFEDNQTGQTEVVVLRSDYGMGVYVDKNTMEAKVLGLLSIGEISCCDAVPVIDDIRKAVAAGNEILPSIKKLPITLRFCDLSKGRINKLPNEWAIKLKQSMTFSDQKLLVVLRRMAMSDTYEKLQENDIILSVNGRVLTCMREFNETIEDSQNKVTFKLLRDYDEVEVDVETAAFSTLRTTRILRFAGLAVQDVHTPIYYFSTPENLRDGGVYVNFRANGSPAQLSRYSNEDITVTNKILGKLIIKVNGENVKNVDEFLTAIKKVKDKEFVRLTSRNYTTGEESVHNIRLDLYYWKTVDMVLNEDGIWVSKDVVHAI